MGIPRTPLPPETIARFQEESRKIAEECWKIRKDRTYAENSVAFRTGLVKLAYKVGQNGSEAARLLGISRSALAGIMKTLGLVPEKVDRKHCNPCIVCDKMFTSYSGQPMCMACREKHLYL